MVAALAGLPGVSAVDLSLQLELVRVTASSSGPAIHTMIHAVGEAGFTAKLVTTPSENLYWQSAFAVNPTDASNQPETPAPTNPATTATSSIHNPSTRPDLAALHADPTKLPETIRAAIKKSSQRANLQASHNQLTIIFFHAPWCPACQHMHDTIENDPDLKQLLANHTFVSIDTDADPETARACLVTAIPEIRILNPKSKFQSSLIGKHSAQTVRSSLAAAKPDD